MQSSEWMPRGEEGEGEGEGLINFRQTERRGDAESPQAVNMQQSKAGFLDEVFNINLK